jgi:HK97 gp10 family phage protein
VTIRIDVTGLRAVEKEMKDFPPKLEKKVKRKAARIAARPIVDDIKRSVPVVTGTLQRAYKIRALKRSRKQKQVGVRVMTDEGFFKGDAFYGGFLELGTKYIESRSFLVNSMERRRQDVREAFTQELRRIVAEEKGKAR